MKGTRKSLEPRNPYCYVAKHKSGAGPHKFNRKAVLDEIRAAELEEEILENWELLEQISKEPGQHPN